MSFCHKMYVYPVLNSRVQFYLVILKLLQASLSYFRCLKSCWETLSFFFSFPSLYHKIKQWMPFIINSELLVNNWNYNLEWTFATKINCFITTLEKYHCVLRDGRKIINALKIDTRLDSPSTFFPALVTGFIF